MKIALIMERIETWRGGAETSTMQFAQHLADSGCEVTIVTATQAQSTPEIQIAPISVNGLFRASKTLLFAHRAADYVRANKFDIVHSITPCPAADVYQPRGGTVPETLQRNLALRAGPVRRMLKRVSQATSAKYRVVAQLERDLLEREPRPWVIAISQYVADQLARHYRYDPQRIRLIFNGVDPDTASEEERREHRRQIRKQFGLAENDVVALCVAHNFKLKGVGPLIQALALRRSRLPATMTGNGRHGIPNGPDLYVVVVGRDKLPPYMRMAGRLGVADRVLFSGPTQRIAAFFHAADFLVHPTYYDPCSRVVLEAMAAGLPVITTRFNGAAERITEGREGFVIDSATDIAAMADRMDRLSDPEQRQRCGECAAAAVDGFTMARHAEGVLALYRDILAEREGEKVGR